ncbi:MAG: hypothetical protein V3R24_02215 [Gemmatimonadales bacterium]
MVNPSFDLPGNGERAVEARWVGVSVVVHLFVLFLISLTVKERSDSVPFPALAALARTQPFEVIEIPVYLNLLPVGGSDSRDLEPGAAPALAGPIAPVAAADGLPASVIGDSIGDISPLGFGRTVAQALQPAFGTGTLWIHPIEVGPARQDVIRALGELANLDSLVAERIIAYLDTVPPDSFAVAGLPNWTTEIDGQTWGMDGAWIYLGPLKIPTALLALIPQVGGDFDRSQAAASLQRMREDIIGAARRAENMEQFKDYVNQTRQRRDEERRQEMERREREEEEPAPDVDLVP